MKLQMKLYKKCFSWVLNKKWYILSYIVSMFLSILISNLYLNSELNSCRQDLQDDITYGIFSNKKSFGVRDESYTIVPYTKSVLPKMAAPSDSSSYSQQYGGLNNYFVASGGWVIKIFKKEGDVITETIIQPFSAGYNSVSNSNPEQLFRRTYNNIIKDEDFNIDINNEYKETKLKSLENKFYVVKSNYLGYDNGLMWYDYYDGKGFTKLTVTNQYYISEKSKPILGYRILYSFISLVICTIVYITILKLLNRKKKNRNFNLEITLNNSEEDNVDSQIEWEDLLKKLQPSNFMSPYDPEKVKIANDLYSALLNSKGNETIISMIREKAYSKLGIK